MLRRFREGAWLIELVPVRDPDDVVEAVASHASTRLSPTPTIDKATIHTSRSRDATQI